MLQFNKALKLLSTKKIKFPLSAPKNITTFYGFEIGVGRSATEAAS